jgi:hypothetical protein
MASQQIQNEIDAFANNPNIDIRGKRYTHNYNMNNSKDYEARWKEILKQLEIDKAVDTFCP